MKERLFDKTNGGFRAGLYYVLFLAAFIIISFLLHAVSTAAFIEGSAGYYLINCFAAPIALLTVLFTAKFLFTDKINIFLNGRFFSRTFLAISVALTFGMFFGLGFINSAFVDLLEGIGIDVKGTNVYMNNAFEYILCVFSLCVVPAVAEELFFRGVIISLLKNAGVYVSCLISALFFALFHFSLAQLIYQFIFGFFLAFMTIRAGSVLPAVISHFLNNFAVLSFTYFNVFIDFYYAPFILSGLTFLAMLSIALVFFNTGKREKKKGEVFSAFFPFGIIGIIICVVLIISSILL